MHIANSFVSCVHVSKLQSFEGLFFYLKEFSANKRRLFGWLGADFWGDFFPGGRVFFVPQTWHLAQKRKVTKLINAWVC